MNRGLWNSSGLLPARHLCAKVARTETPLHGSRALHAHQPAANRSRLHQHPSNPVRVVAGLHCVHGRRALDRLLIDATFGFTIEANLFESFTGQGLFKGEEAAPASRKIEPSAGSEGTN